MQRRVTSASSNYTRLTQSYNFVSKVKCFKFILLRNGVDTAGHIYSYFNLRCYVVGLKPTRQDRRGIWDLNE